MALHTVEMSANTLVHWEHDWVYNLVVSQIYMLTMVAEDSLPFLVVGDYDACTSWWHVLKLVADMLLSMLSSLN